MRSRGVGALILAAPALGGCLVHPGGPGTLRGPACVEASHRAALPMEVRESSGVAPAAAGGFWTHNDSGWPAELFRVDAEGRLLQRVVVEDAGNVDWEDMAAGPCPGGAGGGRCLYLADTGDNRERRETLTLYRIAEPAPGMERSEPARRLAFRLPHGPRDIEALLLVEGDAPEGEGILLVTKGRNHPVEVYRVEGVFRHGGAGEEEVVADGAAVGGGGAAGGGGAVSGEGAAAGRAAEEGGGTSAQPVTARRIQQLGSGPARWGELMVGGVTGGGAAPLAEGGFLAVLRDYESMTFHRVGVEGGLTPVEGGRVSLRSLREPQGEAVAFLDDGRMVLTSEGGPGGGPGVIQLLDCSRGFAAWGVRPLSR